MTKPLIQNLRHRFFKREDTEHEQSLIRFCLALGVFVYLIFIGMEFEDLAVRKQVLLMSALYLLFSIYITVWIAWRPRKSALRRLTGIFADTSIVTYALVAGGETTTPFLGGYLWVTMANGFRYGRQYMKVTHILSIIGFSFALYMTPYWRENLVLGLGLLFWLTLLPVYLASLLKRLETAVDEAKEAHRAKSRFLANMSHELRTPLNGILGYSRMLQEDVEAIDQKTLLADLGRIETSGHHLLYLINEILDYSKIEAGNMQAEKANCNVKNIVSAALDKIRPQADINENQLSSHIDKQVAEFVTDPEKLEQIIAALLGNACKFTKMGKVDISFSKQHIVSDDWVVIEVRDTGIGMTEEESKNIFSPFVQADGSATRKYGGSGLGLAIVSNLCNLMGGTIEVESLEGRGSCFRVYLPFEESMTNSKVV